MDFDVGEFGVDTESEIGREGPGSGRPGEESGRRIVDEFESDSDCSNELDQRR